jgi:SNF2 family DNA or RNA helicase
MEQDLMRRLHSIAFRATKAECLDLPEITDIVRPIELEPLTLKKYKELVRQSYTELSSGEVTATNILTRLLRLSQLTGGFIGSDEGRTIEQVSDAKLKALEDILDSTQQEGQKLVIIARFIPEIHAICRMLRKKNIGYACIYGAIKDRQEQVTMFQNDPDCVCRTDRNRWSWYYANRCKHDGVLLP